MLVWFVKKLNEGFSLMSIHFTVINVIRQLLFTLVFYIYYKKTDLTVKMKVKI